MTFRNIVIAVVALAVAAVIAGRCHNDSISEWEARVGEVQRLVEEEKARADAAAARAEAASERADSIAEEAEEAAPEIRERIVRVEAETPDSLRDHPAVVERDSIITDLRTESRQWKTAYMLEKEANADLREALFRTRTALDSITAVVQDRPGERPWWLPRLGVGPYAGWGADGEPSIGPVSVNLSWEIGL